MKLPLCCSIVIVLVGIAATNASAADDAPKSPELKVLDRLVGKWESASISKVAEWTPAEIRATGKLTREWILDGRFLQETSTQSDVNAIVMFTYDSQKSAYRWW